MRSALRVLEVSERGRAALETRVAGVQQAGGRRGAQAEEAMKVICVYTIHKIGVNIDGDGGGGRCSGSVCVCVLPSCSSGGSIARFDLHNIWRESGLAFWGEGGQRVHAWDTTPRLEAELNQARQTRRN